MLTTTSIPEDAFLQHLNPHEIQLLLDLTYGFDVEHQSYEGGTVTTSTNNASTHFSLTSDDLDCSFYNLSILSDPDAFRLPFVDSDPFHLPDSDEFDPSFDEADLSVFSDPVVFYPPSSSYLRCFFPV